MADVFLLLLILTCFPYIIAGQEGRSMPDSVRNVTEMRLPSWLSALTGGMEYWPGIDPPFISNTQIDLNVIPRIPPRGMGECSEDRTICSFDCHICLRPSDIYTCGELSQSFDDGPQIASNQLYDYLNQTGQRTTLFLHAMSVLAFPDLVRKAFVSNNLLGMHTWSHPYLPSLSNEQVFAELQWNIWAINATTGMIPKYYRPPYGGVDDRIRAIASQLGLSTVLWDKDTFDWRLNVEGNSFSLDDLTKVAGDWKSKGSGGLILGHDSLPMTVEAAIAINKVIGPNQKTVAECAGLPAYQNTIPFPISQ